MGLFRRDVTLAVLASGSAGNCTYIGDGRAGVLIDCGISTKRILSRMEGMGLQGWPIDAVCVTHEHSDHVSAARVLGRKLRKLQGKEVPFYMTAGTHDGTHQNCKPEQVEYVRSGESFRVRHITVEPFTVPHDVLDPVAYRVTCGEVTVAVVTDLGRPTALVARKLRDCDALVLEFNHDLEQLMRGPYPWHLKQRIRSNHGHLSNAQAAQLLGSSLTPRLKHLTLAHLSEENNTPERAWQAARGALDEGGLPQVPIAVAGQAGMAEPIRLSTNVW